MDPFERHVPKPQPESTPGSEPELAPADLSGAKVPPPPGQDVDVRARLGLQGLSREEVLGRLNAATSALNALQHSVERLGELWSSHEGAQTMDGANELCSEPYPFAKSFDEVVPKVQAWTAAMADVLEKANRS